MREKWEPVTTVVHRTTVTVGIPGDLVVPLAAEFCYDMTDPYAVRLTFSVSGSKPVKWVFARMLLEHGMNRPVGIGSVVVRPAHSRSNRNMRIVLKAITDDGVALIGISALEVAEFLRRSYRLVPAGAESLHVDLDRELEKFIDICE